MPRRGWRCSAACQTTPAWPFRSGTCPFGFRFVAADPFVFREAAEARGVSLVSLEELLAQSDIVSLQVFLNAQIRRLIDAQKIALVKPGAYLINTLARPVVDEKALADALASQTYRWRRPRRVVNKDLYDELAMGLQATPV